MCTFVRDKLWIVTTVYFSSTRGEDVVSTATAQKDGSPMLSLKKVGANSYSASVMSIEYAETIFRLAGDKKLLEVRSCLEGIFF